MEEHNYLDDLDRNILRILSIYENLDPLELWYELGECDPPVERVTQEEVLNRLESLRVIGFIERIIRAGGQIHWALKERETEASSNGSSSSMSGSETKR